MIFPVTEGIFYYSLMPKLGEMLFTPAVAFNAEEIAKLTQWLFGILTSVAIYKISRRYFDSVKSFFAVLIFYSSLVVAWESTVAYVDLIRAFFEVMALWAFLVWRDSKDTKTLLEAGVFLGLAISKS
jgi:4-amino-4-deoxy-L-arabinose transferase-like glycosyltransferase